MDTYQRAVIHEAIERIAGAIGVLVQEEHELQTLLNEDSAVNQSQHMQIVQVQPT